MRWSMGQGPVVGLQRDGEVRGLEVLGQEVLPCQIGQGQMRILVLRCLGRGPVTGQAVEGLELLASDGGGRGRHHVVGAGPYHARGLLQVRAHRRTRTIVGRGAAAMTIGRGPTVIQVIRRIQGMVVVVVVMVGRVRGPLGVGLDGGAPRQGPLGLLRVGRPGGHPSPLGRGRPFDDVRRAAHPLEDVLLGEAVAAPADDRVDAEADLGLGGHRYYWRWRRERHHRTRRVAPGFLLLVVQGCAMSSLTSPASSRRRSRPSWVFCALYCLRATLFALTAIPA